MLPLDPESLLQNIRKATILIKIDILKRFDISIHKPIRAF